MSETVLEFYPPSAFVITEFFSPNIYSYSLSSFICQFSFLNLSLMWPYFLGSFVSIYFSPSIHKYCVSSYKPLTSAINSQSFISNPVHSESSSSVISILCWTSLFGCVSNRTHLLFLPNSFFLDAWNYQATIYPNQRSGNKI